MNDGEEECIELLMGKDEKELGRTSHEVDVKSRFTLK